MDEMSTLALLGGPAEELPERYRSASPAESLPHTTPELLVWGTRDRPDLVDNNFRYRERALAAGGSVDALELVDEDHFTVIDPASPGWPEVLARLEAAVRPRSSA
jgi:hypothetical protein